MVGRALEMTITAPREPKNGSGSRSNFLHPYTAYAFGWYFDLSRCLGGQVDNMRGLPGKPIVHNDFDGTTIAQVGYFDTGTRWKGFVGGT